MGTRGVYGFRKNGVDKLSYNHFDSYPTGLGVTIKNFIIGLTTEELSNYYDWIVMVPQIYSERAEDFLSRLKIGTSIPMQENSAFIKDSLFCEWGYIINIDDQVLEIYKGLQKTIDENPRNRYAKEEVKLRIPTQYYACHLIAEIPFRDLYCTDMIDFGGPGDKPHNAISK